MALSYAQLEGVWIQAGGDPAKAAIAAAVAMAESAGNPNSHNGNAGTGDDSYGLWQINMLGSMGPERRTRYNLPNNQALFDPVTNARVAIAMSGNGNDWGPWTTFTSGAYRRYLQGGVPPNMVASGAGGSAGNPATTTAFNPLSNQAWSNLIGNVGNYTFLGFLVLLGSVLAIAGLIVLIRNESAREATMTVGGGVGNILGAPGRGLANAVENTSREREVQRKQQAQAARQAQAAKQVAPKEKGP